MYIGERNPDCHLEGFEDDLQKLWQDVGRYSDSVTSESCRQLLKEIPTTLPDALDPQIPTLLARWPSFGATHISLKHFEHNLFNLSWLASTLPHLFHTFLSLAYWKLVRKPLLGLNRVGPMAVNVHL
ncbi:hypothetical protein C8R44DRAFT_742482 [Mycena epipterygia]|nr:hypothetical protein C8R44DRAFT_742482 [Mycena epipterygia]